MWCDLQFNVFVVGVFLFSVGSGLDLNTAVRRSPPGLGSPPKLWWAKEITSDFHIAGRPTERQIKYAYEGGFKSIFSMYIYEDNDPGNIGGEYLPTTTEAAELARSLGLGYKSFINKKADWWTPEVVQMFANAIQDLQRPILLHCNRGYTIAFVTLMHMANLTRYDPGFEPKIYSNNFYRIVAAMGLDFTADHIKETVAVITGEDFVTDPPKPDAVPSDWRNWWLPHPVAKNWFAAGQLRRADVKVLKKAGFKTVVNLRLGSVHNKQPSIEQVTLLNVIDNTATFATSSHRPARQSTEVLERSRINPELGPEYIGSESEVNYERQNPWEFGDDIGYSQDEEKDSVTQEGLAYYHIPTDLRETFKVEEFRDILDDLLKAGEEGPVVVHCRDGQRAAYLGVLAAAKQEGYSVVWALNRLQELGFEASPDNRPDVLNLYKTFLTSGETPQEKQSRNVKIEL